MLSLQDPRIPEYARRRMQVVMLLMTVHCGATLLAVWLLDKGVLSPGWMVPWMLIGLGLLRAWHFWILSRLRKRIVEIDYQACKRCAYSLHGLDGFTGCPECGLRQSVAESTRIWREWSQGQRG